MATQTPDLLIVGGGIAGSALACAMTRQRTQVVIDTGPEADALRSKIFPLWGQDRTRHPDTFISGPGQPLDETARRRFFGEE
ncbi:MAG: hypothetical protein BZY88_05300 [SAR202 cluster bacterium Io17-Chloro-G9]|nr:MAG: hypothetical protein BZY88_05300 [SAR202 cluster bacterium Io17-Chloro-G9]